PRRAQQQARFGVGNRIRRRRTRWMHAVGYNHRAFRSDQIVRQQLIARGRAIARHQRCSAKTAERSFHHLFEKDRTVLLLRIHQALKSVEVMAGNNRSLNRQLVQELSIAVIDHVEKIELSPVVTNYSRIVPKAIEEAVGVKEMPITPKTGKPAPQRGGQTR